MRMPSSRNRRSGTVDGASHIRSVPRAVFGKRNHLANGGFARQNHHQSVQAERDSTVRRRAIFQRFQQKAEAPFGFFIRKSERRKNLGLHVAAMNTNGARTQLRAVQHHVVRFGAAARRIAGQLVDILVVHRSERMVRRVPAILFFVPFEHRKIHHPEQLEIRSDRAACAGRCISARRTGAVARKPDRTSLRDAGPWADPAIRRSAAGRHRPRPTRARACSTSFGSSFFRSS